MILFSGQIDYHLDYGTAIWLLKQEQEGWELGIDLIIVVCYWLISCQ